MDGPPVTQAHAHVHPHAHVASTETMASIASVIRSLEEELDRLNRYVKYLSLPSIFYLVSGTIALRLI